MCRAFHSLVGTVSQTLTPGMYEFLCNMQTEVADAKGKTSAAKVKREGRHVPNLVRPLHPPPRNTVSCCLTLSHALTSD